MASSRPPYPGFKVGAEPLNMEAVYKQRCEEEERYIHDRTKNPPVCKEPLGKMGNFKVNKYRTYVDLRPSSSGVASLAGSQISGVSRRSSQRSERSLRRSEGSAPRSLYSESRYSGGRSGPPRSASAGSLAASARPASVPEEPVLERSTFVLPKYALARYTMTHMNEMEKNPENHGSSQNLKKVLKMPVNTLRHWRDISAD